MDIHTQMERWLEGGSGQRKVNISYSSRGVYRVTIRNDELCLMGTSDEPSLSAAWDGALTSYNQEIIRMSDIKDVYTDPLKG